MKLKHTAALTAFALCSSMSAQDIYKVETLSGSDLNGTARYVGMGGAMSALGADMSAIGTNPAAIGLYRRSDVALTGSATIQPNGKSFAEINKARGSFDQAGFVLSFKTGNGKGMNFANFAFNYQKRRNLKNFIGLDNIATPSGASQSWQMQELAYYNGQGLDLSKDNDCNYTTPLAIAGYDAQMIVGSRDANGKLVYTPCNSMAYNYYRAQWGGIQQYDFNLSFNISNQFYVGATFGVYNVNMHSHLEYDENLSNDGAHSIGAYNMNYDEAVTGTGFDAKVGFIYRPIEESPFRIGLSVSTPIFYDLTHDAYLYMESPFPYIDTETNQRYNRTASNYTVNDLNYRIRTPWKLNISAATTVGNYLALDAEYEVSRYTGAQVRYPDYNRYDYWSDSYTSSIRDREMDKEIDAMLNTVQTLRIGAEVRMASGLFGRIGYNFVSSPFKKDAYLNTFTESPSYHYSLNSDYVNLGAINRLTLGLGYRYKHFYLDMAYQYQHQHGDVYAFRATDSDSRLSTANLLQAQNVNLDRHNVMLTLGFKF